MKDCIENLIALLIHEEGNYEAGNLFMDFYSDNLIPIPTKHKNSMVNVLEELECAPYLSADTTGEIKDLLETLKQK